MKELMKEINNLLNQAGIDKNSIIFSSTSKPVYPFSEVGQILTYMVSAGVITYNQYLQLSEAYNQRNKYLYLFEMAPRTFGETWGERHIMSLFSQFKKETKKHNPNFDGEYDLILNNIRVEVKACRANNEDRKSGNSLPDRAYTHSEALKSGFRYHFQQLKPSCCDVFIWIGVCRDELIYWVLMSDELSYSDKFYPQHRNVNTGIADVKVYEGQVFMTEEELLPFHVKENDILNAVLRKA